MLKRKIERELMDWKEKHDKKCLLVKGARQVGKTYIIDKFARENYKYYTYINFDENPAYQTIFDGDLDVDTLIKQISLRVRGAELEPHETILFLDEIQNCPRARTALKFLAIDGRFDVVASGSMLGIHYKEVPSYPVGYVDYLEMYSMDFEEFLWANDVREESIEDIREYFGKRSPVPEAMHQRMLELFREYIVVGGMPRVVQEFVNSHNFAKVYQIQKGILTDYTDDIAKYAEGAEKTKARACFLSIPKHLAKDYKKFRYSLVEPKATNRKYGGSLMWLYDAGIINFCYNLSEPALPLEANARSDAFKVYMRDTGLLMAMLDEGAAEDIIDGNLGIYKGAVYENIIADILAKNGKKLYYYEKNSQIEIDFFIRYQKTATAVEVKSAEKAASKSMTAIIKNYGVKHGIKLSTQNVSGNETVETFPLYMAMFL
ncbi:MAG: ATP-binding protein [Lachnospiraceae bacterium]|nr:ATP-binding protein [Lachnospiraceae bacterium]